MIRTVFFFTALWLSMILSLIFLIPLLILILVGNKRLKKRYIKTITSEWSKIALVLAGVRVITPSRQELPETGYVFVSNHQSYFDIPVIMSILSVTPAFIAKQELKKTPFLNIWMNAVDCLFIDRSDSAGSRKKIMKRLMEKGRNPLLLFPEGTRSRRSKMLSFRTGGLKMVFDSGIDVVPVRITDTYRIWEENRRIVPGKVKVEILPPLKTKSYTNNGFGNFIADIKNALNSSSDGSDIDPHRK